MDGIISWLNDKKNLPIVIAAAAIIILLIVVFLKMSGKLGGASKEKTTASATDAASSATSATGTTGASGAPSTVPGMPGMMPGGMPGMPGMGGTQQAAEPETPGIQLPPMLPYRKDPFVQIGGTPSKRDELIAKLPSLSHTRFAPMQVNLLDTSSKVENLPPQPTRRLAGILYNSRVSAILETNGVMDIIKPGTVLDRGNSKVLVESIMKNAVVLKTLDTKKPMRIVVSLMGSPNASSNDNPVNNMGGGNMMMPGGMPTMPGGMPMMPGGMPMMPGVIGN